MDSAWEQKKLEARKLLAVGAADRASELQANIAQPKRMSAGHPQRPVHAVLGGDFCSINPISISDYPSFLLSFYMPMPRRGAALRYLIICCMFLFQIVRWQLF